jgi:hypothetical protein
MKETVDDALSVDEAARALGLQKSPVYFLIKRGLLTTYKATIGGTSQILFVTTKSINSFSSKYVLAAKLASDLHTTSGYLTRLLIGGGIKPISGPAIDKGRGFIFRRRDLKKIDLEKLINKERRHRRSRDLSPLVSLDETSELLEIRRELIQEYVENGVLKPYKQRDPSSSSRRSYASPGVVSRNSKRKL